MHMHNTPLPRVSHSSTILNDHLYIFGGETKEGDYLNDMWSFNLLTHQFSQIINDMKPEDLPAGRSGHTMVSYQDSLIIFGGKAGNMNESNDLWKFDLKEKKFVLIHDTLLELFTEKELQDHQPKKEEPIDRKKTFKVLTKKDIPALNPMNKSKKDFDIKKRTMHRSMYLEKTKINYEHEVLKSPLGAKLKKSIIYNQENDMNGVLHRLSTLFQSHSHKSLLQETCVSGIPPLPRDGHSCLVYENKLIVFGGDRNKFPFNDLFSFSLNNK
jgi:hypothetical protein